MFGKMMNEMKKMTRKDILYLERGTMPSRLENEVYFLTWSERGVSAENCMHSFRAVSLG